jgi:hypothetical protein
MKPAEITAITAKATTMFRRIRFGMSVSPNILVYCLVRLVGPKHSIPGKPLQVWEMAVVRLSNGSDL